MRSRLEPSVILPLLPPGLRKTVRSGPLDGNNWCLLEDNTAAESKLRQMMPAMKLALEHKGFGVGELRIKVQPTG